MRRHLLDQNISVENCEFDSEYIIVTIVEVWEYRPNVIEWIWGVRKKSKEIKNQYRSQQAWPSRWYKIPDYSLVDDLFQITLHEIRDRRKEFDKYITAIEKHKSPTNKKQ